MKTILAILLTLVMMSCSNTTQREVEEVEIPTEIYFHPWYIVDMLKYPAANKNTVHEVVYYDYDSQNKELYRVFTDGYTYRIIKEMYDLALKAKGSDEEKDKYTPKIDEMLDKYKPEIVQINGTYVLKILR